MSQESSLDINLAEGRISVTGSESFVKHMFGELKPFLQARPTPTPPGSRNSPETPPESSNSAKKPAKKKGAANSYVPPIEFDLEGDGTGLPQFWAQKSPPRNHQDQITVLTYWLNKHGGVDGVSAGHLMYAYQELGLAKPANPAAAINNTKARSKTVVVGPEPGTIRVNNPGENFVNGLPKKQE